MTDSIPPRIPAPESAVRKRRWKYPPLVVDAKRFADLLGAGVRSIRTWDAAGKIPAPIRIGGRVVWRVREIRSWLAAGAPNRDQWEALKLRSQK